MPAGIAYGGAFLFLVAAFLVAWGLLTVYRLSLKPLLLGLASLFFFSVGGFGFSLGRPLAVIGNALRSLAESIDHGLAEAVLASEHGIVWLWHALAKQAEWLGGLLGDLAETIEAKFRIWYLAFPPLAAIWAAVKLAQQLPQLWRAIHTGAAHVVHISEFVYKQGAQVTNVTKNYVGKAAHAAVAATVGTVAAPLPWARGRIGELERDASYVRGQLGRIAHTLTPAGIIALVGATFFSSFGLGWLRCRGVNRVGRGLCGLTTLIEAAALDALTAFAAIDLCWFIHGIETAAVNIRPLLLKFVDLENALIGRCGGDAAAPLVLPGVSRTPVVDGLKLKAL